jgi:hypothetical protein
MKQETLLTALTEYNMNNVHGMAAAQRTADKSNKWTGNLFLPSGQFHPRQRCSAAGEHQLYLDGKKLNYFCKIAKFGMIPLGLILDSVSRDPKQQK